jgi:hypothetical protein
MIILNVLAIQYSTKRMLKFEKFPFTIDVSKEFNYFFISRALFVYPSRYSTVTDKLKK